MENPKRSRLRCAVARRNVKQGQSIRKPAGLNPAALILLLALLGGGGVFAYLKLVKNKPKTKGNDSLDDYDYGEEDSEEWETEDEEVLEDGFEGSDPNEERDRAD